MDVNMMWMNNKQQVLMPSMVRGYAYESWEERAFAEDAARGIGGFIWPPRSYTCSFCRREFKSAQALGGHMNVHRRDRAKLKQALSPTSSETIRHTDTTTFVTCENSPNAVGDEMKRESAKDKEEQQYVSTKLCMGLRLDEVGNNKCKRLKFGDNFILVDHPCVVVRSSSSQLHHEATAQHGGVIQSKMSLMEELDLELRLGM